VSGKTRKQQLEEMLAAEPDDPFLRYGLAMEHVSAGADDEAVRCFGELMAKSPDYVPAYLQAGQALIRLGRDDEARRVWRTGIDVARRQGNKHAADEMTDFLDRID
jgi:Flp pilus assembly protein TadD